MAAATGLWTVVTISWRATNAGDRRLVVSSGALEHCDQHGQQPVRRVINNTATVTVTPIPGDLVPMARTLFRRLHSPPNLTINVLIKERAVPLLPDQFF